MKNPFCRGFRGLKVSDRERVLKLQLRAKCPNICQDLMNQKKNKKLLLKKKFYFQLVKVLN